jgi:hypothetical protein
MRPIILDEGLKREGLSCCSHRCSMLRRGPARRTVATLCIGSIALLSVAAAACGGSNTNSAQSTTTSTTAQSTGQNVEADKAAAQTASLTLSDFPAGWTSKPSSNNNPSQDITAQLAKCLGVSQADLTKPPASYDSPTFSESGSSNSASSNVGYRASAADEQSAFAIVSGSKVPDCLTTAVAAVINEAIQHPTNPSDTLPAGAKVGTTTVSPMSFPQFGDKSIAYQVKVPISYSSLSIDAYLDVIYSIKGRAGVSMEFEGVTDPFPVDQAEHYTGLVVGRLTNT